MYKILLSDDEPIVLDSLQQIIRLQYGDRCQVNLARSGREAITQAESLHPDLAVMDINMPGINGIEAIKAIHEISPGTQFMLLTAFDSFDYAKQAINLGVLEYLTKPFNRKLIIDAFDAALARIESLRQRRTSELEMREKLENVRSILETGFFYTFLFSDDQTSETARYLALLDLPSPDGLIMTLEFGEHPDEDQPQNRIGMNIRVNRGYEALRTYIKLSTPCLVGPLILNRIVLFLPMGTGSSSSQEARVPALADLIRKRVERDIDTGLRIGVSQPVESVSQYHSAYQESVLALQLAPVGGIGHFREAQYSMLAQQTECPDILVNSLLQAVRQGDSERVVQLYARLLSSLEAAGPANLPHIKSRVLEWLALASRQGGRPGSIPARTSCGPAVPLDYAALLTADSLDELRQISMKKILDLTAQYAGIRGRPVNDLVAQARAYIDERYTGDISLESVAELISLSPPYFSRLFRSQVGKTFIDYLTDLRIGRACQLLREGRLSIKEISSAIGYADPNYFGRIFKRIIGQTPSEYRS